jgi:hypothetical protein
MFSFFKEPNKLLEPANKKHDIETSNKNNTNLREGVHFLLQLCFKLWTSNGQMGHKIYEEAFNI